MLSLFNPSFLSISNFSNFASVFVQIKKDIYTFNKVNGLTGIKETVFYSDYHD